MVRQPTFQWYRLLRSGQKVSYNGMVFSEVSALATALDEWEYLQHQRRQRAKA